MSQETRAIKKVNRICKDTQSQTEKKSGCF